MFTFNFPCPTSWRPQTACIDKNEEITPLSICLLLIKREGIRECSIGLRFPGPLPWTTASKPAELAVQIPAVAHDAQAQCHRLTA